MDRNCYLIKIVWALNFFIDDSGSENGQMLSGVGLLWPIMMVVSSAFQAGATIIKVIHGNMFIFQANNMKTVTPY